MDIDGDGKVSHDEWVAHMQGLTGNTVLYMDVERPYPLREASRRFSSICSASSAVETRSRRRIGALPKHFLDAFTSFSAENVRQRPADGTPIANYDELIKYHEPVTSRFELLMRDVVTARASTPTPRRCTMDSR